MNKKELKSFAVEARRDLREKVALKAEQFGITETNQVLEIKEDYGQLIVNNKTFPVELKQALHTLKKQIDAVGYDQLIEEVAYTWFNRIIAIRYMEVNNYLPDRVNVLSSSTGKNEPDILMQYQTMNLDVQHDQISKWIQTGDNEQAYRHLFIAQCNTLSDLLPFLFEEIEDYTELLLPDYLLDQESIIRKTVTDLATENFHEIKEDGLEQDNVEVLGWLYQYYMSEKKEKVGGLKNSAVKKEDLPVITQLFTPKWIVQYMVQNSLGKLYDEKYEDNQLAKHWEYYLKHEENHHLYPEFDILEDLKIMDPACGSGHILLYAFDMLYDMYEEAGYPTREIPQLILENNLYGLDIDKRAQQIANFALLMKAAEKQPRFISRLSRKEKSPKLNVYEIIDADQTLSEEAINYFVENETEKSLVKELLNQFESGKQFGSLINSIEVPYEGWLQRFNSLKDSITNLMDEVYYNELAEKFYPVLKQAYLLYQSYDVVVTNPPYHNKYNPTLKKFMVENYKDYKSDLYSAFIYKTSIMVKENGYAAIMTPYTWMFISSHEKLRNFILKNKTFSSLVQLEYSAFEEATVPICTFVIHNQTKEPTGEYVRLSDFKGANLQPQKLKAACENNALDYRYTSNGKTFSDIPGSPIAYWASDSIIKIFNNGKLLGNLYEIKSGIMTGNDNKFLRLWTEVNYDDISFVNSSAKFHEKSKKIKWFPINKGGDFRLYYGNNEYIINLKNMGFDISNSGHNNRLRDTKYYFRKGLTWSRISSKYFAFRLQNNNQLFGDAGPLIVEANKTILGFLNSVVAEYLLSIINPTINIQVLDIERLPILDENNCKVDELVTSLINIYKNDWDKYECSWEFIKHPLFDYNSELLAKCFSNYKEESTKNNTRIDMYKKELNNYFLKLYKLEGVIDLEDLKYKNSIEIQNRFKMSKSFLSYFIGCLVSRYSLDVEGLAYAGGEFDESKYQSLKPVSDGVVQLTDAHYFDDDIIARLREFLSVAFSPDTVDENMAWLAESLEMKKNELPEERLRRYFLDEFFKDHCQMYKKRPIYWLVDSGKQKGLRTLIYMHRYQPDTMATIRFEHLQEIQSKYQNEIDMIDTRLANPSLSASDKKGFEKAKINYQKKLDELQTFDKKLASYANEQIAIDLDDGVKVNYAKFDEVLTKIK